MKISTAIERAINTTLWDGESQLNDPLMSEYSCIAIAINILLSIDRAQYAHIDAGLVNMGLDTTSCVQFHGFEFGPRRQYARALWLTWAALMAKEQGL